jgi:hypothetical protein
MWHCKLHYTHKIALFGGKLEHFIIHIEHTYTYVNSSKEHPNSVTNVLLDTDMDWHHDTSHVQLNTLLNTTSYKKIFLINVSTVYHSIHDTKVVFWAKKNLHFIVFKHKPSLVIFCAGMTSNSFDLPCLFDGPVNAPSQAKILQVWLITKLWHKGHMKSCKRKLCEMGPACVFVLAMGTVRCDGKEISQCLYWDLNSCCPAQIQSL